MKLKEGCYLDIEQKAKDKRNEYLRAWRAKNKDKVKTYAKTYWERKIKTSEDSKENNQRGLQR